MRYPQALPQTRNIIIIAAITGLIILWLSLRPSAQVYILPLQKDPDPQIPSIPVHSNSRLLPFRYWNHRALYPDAYTDHACMKLPDVSDLQYASSSWQLLTVDNGSVYIYGAYWDQRFEDPLVRILIYTDIQPVPKLFCQLWFPNDNEPQTELAEFTYAWQPAWGGPDPGINEPYILTCRCRRHKPEADTPPVAVAVVTAPCSAATNVLDVQNAPFEDLMALSNEEAAPHNGTSVGVCLKWLHYRNDVSYQVIEWLELLKTFGAQKVYIYIVRVHPNTRKILKYYESTGFVVITELSHPPQVSGVHNGRGMTDFLDLRRELLPLNDCLYRNIGKHDLIAAIDIDEIIVPEEENTWAEMIEKEAAKGSFDALIFPNYFVLDEAQKDLVGPAKARILSHTWRAKSPSPPGNCVKSFFNTSTVVAMHNHSPMSCGRGCVHRDVPINSTGRLLHYRTKCQYDDADCEALHDVVREHILDRWRASVLKKIDEVLKINGLEPLV